MKPHDAPLHILPGTRGVAVVRRRGPAGGRIRPQSVLALHRARCVIVARPRAHRARTDVEPETGSFRCGGPLPGRRADVHHRPSHRPEPRRSRIRVRDDHRSRRDARGEFPELSRTRRTGTPHQLGRVDRGRRARTVRTAATVRRLRSAATGRPERQAASAATTRSGSTAATRSSSSTVRLARRSSWIPRMAASRR